MGLYRFMIHALLFAFVVTQAAGFRHLPRTRLSARFRTHTQAVLYSASRATGNAPQRPKKFIVVSGGVISGIGKGITASSIGVMLKMMGLRVTAIKIDPYLNVDAGTMSPFEHGETFVLDDGTETDLDLGNYERFLDVKLTNDSNLTTGKIYQAVIAKERQGAYLGKTVQIIPHITNEIMERIVSVSRRPVDASGLEPDVCVIELGGTIGDIESMPFVEALRQLQLSVTPPNMCFVHVSMVPTVGSDKEQKTKPTQHSVKELRSLGLTPDFIVCRCKEPVLESSRSKIALFCNVPTSNVLSIHDLSNVYHVPLLMIEQGYDTLLRNRLQLDSSTAGAGASNLDAGFGGELAPSMATAVSQHAQAKPPAATAATETETEAEGAVTLQDTLVEDWRALADRVDHSVEEATVALVGKYITLGDAYLSIISALKHSSTATDQRLNLVSIDASHLEDDTRISDPETYAAAWTALRAAHGVLVPGGFGQRGIEGKVAAVRYARENKVPFLGICLGMQAAVIEFARNVLNRPNAQSREFAPQSSEEDAAVVFMPEGDPNVMGGTMRLGSRRTVLQDKTLAKTLYSEAGHVDERHRHRYEVNPSLVSTLESHGLVFSGKDETQQRMEILELDAERWAHPYFVGVQFHPEYLSRPQRPAPVFLGLMNAIQEARGQRLEAEKVSAQ